jgi:CheY-like chemotaxis protein/signal transduction histidine kinase/CHASE3 domain sensor protein
MKLRNKLLLGYVLVFALMIVVTVVTYRAVDSLIETQALVDRAHKVMRDAELFVSLLSDMESGERGYVLTGDAQFLEPYETAKASYDATIAGMKNLIIDPAQMARLAEIEMTGKRWIDQAVLPIIEARRKVNEGTAGESMDQVIAMVKAGTGKRFMDSIRQMEKKFVEIEEGILAERQKTANEAARRSVWIVIFGTGFTICFGMLAVFFISRNIVKQVGGEPPAIMALTREVARGNLDVESEIDPRAETGIAASVTEMVATFKDAISHANAVASGDYTVEIIPRSDKDKLRIALKDMTEALRGSRSTVERESWLKTGIARLNKVMIGDLDIETLASRVISEIAVYIDAQVGAFYIAKEEKNPYLALMSSYAYTKRKNLSNVFKPGEGLVGQAALEKQQILVKNVPEDYIKVTSGLGERVPIFICVTPFLYEDRVQGVIELGTLSEMTDMQLEYLDQAMPALAVAVESAESRTKLTLSLEESQRLTEELQVQQEELRTANEELEAQTRRLEASEEKLQAQQEELRVTNEELEEKNELLEQQKKEVELARRDIETKAEELALASKYKSQFLANMSHELRTPLNSLLLLAQLLAENKDGNLAAEQVESAKIIHKSGSDLLNLINEILDLSKIEAGRMDLQLDRIRLSDLAEDFRTGFQHMAAEKGLSLEVMVEKDAPKAITSDRKRLSQVVKNLISNAVKFTESGGIVVRFGRPAAGTRPVESGLPMEDCLAIAVRDTGVGIGREHQKVIFEAFQQVDGSTARKYGGTGLGLSISREIARLLGGEIQLESQPGKGSTFTLYLPVDRPAESMEHEDKRPAPSSVNVARPADRVAAEIEDDRDNLKKEDRIILVIEDDANFARILLKKCHEKGFKCLAAPTGEAGLELARNYLPGGVILDIRLPGMDGWSVLSFLKEETRTRHIPVHVISVEADSTISLRKGAVGHAVKPIDQETLDQAFQRLEAVSPGKPRQVLVVEDDPEIRHRTAKLIGNGTVRVDEAATGAQAMEALRSTHYSCMILDLKLPDMEGWELIERLENEKVELPPIVVHTARDLTREEEVALMEHADSIVIKDVRSQERLLDEVSLFLHQIVSQMPEKKQQIITDLHDTDVLLRDKKVLIVDDDMRTMFALSRLLTERGIKTLKAENGEKALSLLEQHPDVDLVLMDIMMPVMDGYEAMEKIRARQRFHRLPIIALTAKAMKEDREKCLKAGASDYLSKPVDQQRLISMMRVWLYR